MKATAVYTRVSTDTQRDAAQELELQRYIDNHGIQNVRWYRDTASGKDLDRPAFSELQKAVFAGEVGCILCYKLDRISRRVADGAAVIDAWLAAGVRVVSVTQQIDFQGPAGKVMAQMLMVFAEWERALIVERTIGGLAAARKRGVTLGRKKGSKTRKSKRKVDPKDVRRMLDKGMTKSGISRLMGVNRSSVYDALGEAESIGTGAAPIVPPASATHAGGQK